MFWINYLEKIPCPKLTKNITVDTLIIGGGIAGLTNLYKEKAQNTILVEANIVGMGVTAGSSSKITILQEDILAKILAKDYDTAKLYLNSQIDAIKLLKEIIHTENLECDLEKVDSLLIARNNKEIEKVKKISKFLQINNIKVTKLKKINGLKIKAYQINPIKYINGLKKILKNKIYEQTRVIDIKKENNYYLVYTNNQNVIKAQKVIITCQYPFFLKPLFLPLNTTIEKSTIIVTKEKNKPKLNYITVGKPTLSYRSYKNYGIYLSQAKATWHKNNDIYNYKKVKKLFNLKEEDIVSIWTNMDIISGDNLPYIGLIDKNMYIATAFNTWGILNGIISSQIIFDLINNRNNPYINLFNPKRIGKYQKIFNSIFSNIISFIKGIKKNKSWYSSHISFLNIKEKRIGIYTDEQGKTFKVKAICPHLKCPLEFNEIDKTWDCPCHSSRFTYDGKWLKGPSKKDITFK